MADNFQEAFNELFDAVAPLMEEAAVAARFAAQFGIKQTCQYCPVQYEGATSDGRVFYFRARWDEVSFCIGDDLDAAVDGIGWNVLEKLEESHLPHASWLPHDRALFMIAMWLEAYEQERQNLSHHEDKIPRPEKGGEAN